ncbi:MAG: hypothetical protein D6762_09640 [Candidatus Neomarinimicrobiota bacterium]|nr:MAG: hypothetical protein D6762_09640 [Candidatus Neomarinimicrobiota bacterium]
MKGPVKIALISVGAFVVLVAVIFVVLMMLEPDSPAAEVPTDPVAKVTPDAPAQEQPAAKKKTPDTPEDQQADAPKSPAPQLTVADSLAALVRELRNDLFERSVVIDSLNERITFQQNVIAGYQKKIDELNDQILTLNRHEVSLKELAKTYESMKVSDIKPILNKVDDETVIAIYRAMGTRTRKTIMMALSAERAAQITEKLAGRQSGEQQS